MFKKMKFLLICVAALTLVLTAGCSSQTKAPENSSTSAAPVKNESVGDLTKQSPLKVNKSEGTVTFLAQVNGKYFYEPTRHGAVFADGSNGQKAVFRGYANPEDFYKALIEIGAKAGDNMTMENKEKTTVQGDAFDITVNWTGAAKAVTLDQAIKESNGKKFDIRFGGNLKNAQDKKTGCLICLDSCPVGITSNANYSYGAVEVRKEVQFMGNKDVLPADGTYVAITMKLKK